MRNIANNRKYSFLPNLLTVSNAMCGVIAIFLMFSHHEGRYNTAALLIFLGAIFDAADGKVARLLDAESSLGKQLDSLSDLITFGMAPALLYLGSGLLPPNLISYGILAGYIVSGAYRLARYNVCCDNHHFQGCPITLGGIILASIFLFINNNGFYVGQYDSWMLMLFMMLALLMISKVRIKRLI